MTNPTDLPEPIDHHEANRSWTYVARELSKSEGRKHSAVSVKNYTEHVILPELKEKLLQDPVIWAYLKENGYV